MRMPENRDKNHQACLSNKIIKASGGYCLLFVVVPMYKVKQGDDHLNEKELLKIAAISLDSRAF